MIYQYKKTKQDCYNEISRICEIIFFRNGLDKEGFEDLKNAYVRAVKHLNDLNSQSNKKRNSKPSNEFGIRR